MNPIIIDPTGIRAFGDTAASTFCLVTNPSCIDSLTVRNSDRYVDTHVFAIEHEDEFPRLLEQVIPQHAHILCILPDCLLHSVPETLLGERKLLIMACRSGRTELEGVRHFLDAGMRTDPDELAAFADAFFAKGACANALRLANAAHEAQALFHHLSDDYEWHEQLGVLDWGQQQVFPAGEIACFLVPLKIRQLPAELAFRVEGRIALQGGVIVQSGPPSFQLSDQQRIYERLSTIRNHAVLLDVVAGDVTAVQATHAECAPAAQMLEALFAVDSRFRRIYEIGFSINRSVEPWPGNSAMNEVCGGPHGCMHLGLGMLPHTQYHLDIFCAGTSVYGNGDDLLIGPAKIKRRRSAACPCIDV